MEAILSTSWWLPERISGMSKHKWFYRGHHRGVYRPNFHWSHIACYDTYCHIANEIITLHPYVDVVGGGGIDGSTTITFTATERASCVQAM